MVNTVELMWSYSYGRDRLRFSGPTGTIEFQLNVHQTSSNQSPLLI